MKKTKIKAQKRVSFLRIFAAALAIGAVITTVFGLGLRRYFADKYGNDLDRFVNDNAMSVASSIANKHQLDPEMDAIAEGEARLALRSYYNLFPEYLGGMQFEVNSGIYEGCDCANVIVDEDMNIVATSRKMLITIIDIDEEHKSKYYHCYWTPELKKFYDTMMTYDQMEYDDFNISTSKKLKSAYIDSENMRFIPHEMLFQAYKDDEYGEQELIEEKVLTFDHDGEGYELITFADGEGEYPRGKFSMFVGQEQDVIDRLTSDLIRDGNINFYSETENGVRKATGSRSFYVDGKKYYACSIAVLDLNCEPIRLACMVYTGIAAVICFIAALLYSWAANVRNKSRYAFENYQKALINNLAHDMKTPLMAISGYAENAVKSLEKGDTEDVSTFLKAIVENVSYSDSIVNRTLELNHLQRPEKLKKEPVKLHELAEKALEKYTLMLDEKNIKVTTKGEFTPNTDSSSMIQAVENLVSNAVKYTPENGKIDITADKNSLTITNTTTGKIDVDDLVMPFVKGDRSRNGQSGSGLGLAIVRSAVESNKMKLTLSSTDGQFVAKIHR